MLDEREHPVTGQEICSIYWQAPEGFCPYYCIGFDGVTRIEKTTKSGMHANIAYVRVWAGDQAIGEFCQHQLTAIYFSPALPDTDPSQEWHVLDKVTDDIFECLH